jgi:hypothetical protein
MRFRLLCSVLAGLLLGQATYVLADVSLPPPAGHLNGLTSAPITVIEPHDSKPYKPVEVTYQGYPAAPMLDQLLGVAWRAPDALVAFEALDGYLSMIPGPKIQRYSPYLVYANAQGGDFSVEMPPLNHRVSVGPWYLVWNNVLYPELQPDGATYWPFQVTRVGIVDPKTLQPLFPPMLPEKYREGAQLTLKYCLSCHQANGVGGKKMPLDLAQWVSRQSFARFATWVLDPSAKNPLTGMPALTPDRPAAERQLMARQIYGYLRALGALGRQPQ